MKELRMFYIIKCNKRTTSVKYVSNFYHLAIVCLNIIKRWNFHFSGMRLLENWWRRLIHWWFSPYCDIIPRYPCSMIQCDKLCKLRLAVYFHVYQANRSGAGTQGWPHSSTHFGSRMRVEVSSRGKGDTLFSVTQSSYLIKFVCSTSLFGVHSIRWGNTSGRLLKQISWLSSEW